MVLRILINLSGRDVTPPVDVEVEVTGMATAPMDGFSETTGSAVRVRKFDVAHCRHQYMLLRVNRINDSKIPLHDITDPHFLFVA